MSRDLGGALPPSLLRRLGGEEIAAHADQALLVVSLDPEGRPHPAVLSYFEVVALDEATIRLAMYADSRSTENLRRSGAATLIMIDEDMTCYVKGTARQLRRTLETAPHSALLELRVEQVLLDRADPDREGDAAVTGGVTWRDPNREARLAGAADVFREMRSDG